MPDYNQDLREKILARSEVTHASSKAELIQIYKDRYGEADVSRKGTPAWRNELTKDLKAHFPNEKYIHRNFHGGRENKAAGKTLAPKLESFAQEQARKHDEQKSAGNNAYRAIGKASNPFRTSVKPPPGGYTVRFSGTVSISGYTELERDFDSSEFDQDRQEELNEALANDPGDMEPIFDAYMRGGEEAEYESGDFFIE